MRPRRAACRDGKRNRNNMDQLFPVMAIADREDPDADAFRKEWKVESLVTLSEIRAR